MELEHLFARGSSNEAAVDRRGGRTSLDRDVANQPMRDEYARLIKPLNAMDFWQAAVAQNSYLPINGLWAPQRRAVGLSIAHIAARRTAAISRGAALVKMPTGTGKTGVIATLACAVPEIKRTLVITPRRALADQMLRDLHTRFWSRFGKIYDGTSVRGRTEGDPEVGTGVTNGPIYRLLPSQAQTLSSIADERIVMVGTFAALEQVLRPDRPAHRLSGRRPAGHDEIPPDGDELDAEPSDAARQALVAMLGKFDVVVVDESHYEPAFVWSQCIRSLGIPTLLFSATPYRNDFRYFEIDGRFAFSLSFEESRDMRLIRGVEVANHNGATPGETFAHRLVRFADEIGASALPATPAEARVIVRAESHESLVRLSEELERLGHKSVLIHHKERINSVKRLRFNDAVAALDTAQAKDVRFWLHQWKLLEGVDDSRFGGVAVLEPFSTSRAVIQQIGRVLRYQDRGTDEVARVIGAGDVGADLAKRFASYLSYEQRFDTDPGDALKRETNFFETLRNASPTIQYISGDFRNRFELDTREVSFDDFQLPRRAFIARARGVLTLDELAQRSAEAMGLEDRHEITILEPRSGDPDNVRLIAYVQWGNSPLLISKAMPSWALGVMAIVKIDDRIFLLDTERLVVDPEVLGLEPEGPDVLQRLVPTTTGSETCRVTVASAVSLDISDMGTRSLTARMYDFSEGFFDLAQGMQAATSVRALMKQYGSRSVSRYLSLSRATVSDAQGGHVSIAEYEGWTRSLDTRLSSATAPSMTFRRFAQALPAPSAAKAVPKNILFDFADIIGASGNDVPDGWDAARTQSLAHADRSIDVADDGTFQIEMDGQKFDGDIKYKVTGSIRRRGKYIIELPDLDAHLIGRAADAVKQREKSQLLSGIVTRSQAFRVVPADPKLVYAQKHFYRPAVALDVVAKDEPGGPLEAVISSKWLENVETEKGAGTSTIEEWAGKSIFGGVYAQLGYANRGRLDTTQSGVIRACDPEMAERLDAFSIIVCDDGGTETCDFICVDQTTRRVVLIHAKVDDTTMSLNSLQAVGRQAQASLAFLTSIHGFPDRRSEWRKKVPIKDGYLTRRLIKGPKPDIAWLQLRDALRSARYSREIWIFAGRILQRSVLLDRLRATPPKPAVRQMTYYLASLQTSAGRANVGLRIFCSP